MATLKQIRRRIRSVQSTMQITKAMEMVAAAKLRRVQGRALATRPYVIAMQESLARAVEAAPAGCHPLLEPRPTPRRVLVGVIASDKGLCGSFNTHILSEAERHIQGLGPLEVARFPIGRRACRYFEYRHSAAWRAVDHLGDQLDLDLVREIAGRVMNAFITGEVDRVEFVHYRFISTARREVVVDPLVPLAPADSAGGGRQYIFEPDAQRVLGTLVPRFITTRVLSMLADSLAAEHSARMMAMGNATRNAQEMIDALTLSANKLRQATITRELIDIVGGTAGME
ncbi:MAG: ATP synthase F1 subunit gamma [Candidatus Eisenbacteria bacterium]